VKTSKSKSTVQKKNASDSLLIKETKNFDKTIANLKRGFYTILVIREVGLGDVLTCVMATQSLKRKYPESKITFYTSPPYQKFLKRFSWLTDVLSSENCDLDKAMENYDYNLILDLRGVIDYLPFCEKAPRIELFAKRMGIDLLDADRKFRFKPSAREINRAKSIFQKHGNGKKRLVIAPIAQADIRTWDYALDFADEVSEEFDVYLVHSKPIGFTSESIFDLGGTSIEDLAGIVYQSDIVVTPDTGVMHLAGWMDVPFVALFGSIPPNFRIKHFNNYIALYLSFLECVPCWDWQKRACNVAEEVAHRTDVGHHWENGKRRVRKFKRCLKDISVEMVYEAVKKLEKRRKKKKKKSVKLVKSFDEEKEQGAEVNLG
jgi:ADP-heptose:LPS heptosyltransferase